MKRTTTTLMVACAVVTGCVAAGPPPRFEVRDCGMAKFLQAVEDCDKRERAIPYEHCVVHDHRTGCIVGAIKERNPAFSPSSDFGSGKPEYVYTRVYDWECPAGVVPPRKNDFYFESFYSAPLDCDADKSLSPLKQNPLLHLGERPATPPVTETAPN